jgi:hypothetical protein
MTESVNIHRDRTSAHGSTTDLEVATLVAESTSPDKGRDSYLEYEDRKLLNVDTYLGERAGSAGTESLSVHSVAGGSSSSSSDWRLSAASASSATSVGSVTFAVAI